jgi:hypothetical protein
VFNIERIDTELKVTPVDTQLQNVVMSLVDCLCFYQLLAAGTVSVFG